VEAGKKNFAGFELPGRTLGVIGLGAIGRNVANMGVALGMKVVGFDPGLTVEGAWQLSADVKKANSVEEALRVADFVTFHVPLIDATSQSDQRRAPQAHEGRRRHPQLRARGHRRRRRGQRRHQGRQGVRLRLRLPEQPPENHERVITLPHLGASTAEAEDNCAIMVAEQVKDFLRERQHPQLGEFPGRGDAARDAEPRGRGQRQHAQHARPDLRDAGQGRLNIHDMVNRSRGDYAYTVVDLDSPVPEDVRRKIAGINGVLMARII
jgi:D-3-phosphoglycerate dehydrogenase / 2-oxoglutarate reductase